MDLLLSLLSGGNSLFLGLGAALVAVLVAFFKGRSSGAQKERDKAMRDDLRARDIRDEVDNDVGALPPDAARKELGKWSR